jgi:hypothetical protein
MSSATPAEPVPTKEVEVSFSGPFSWPGTPDAPSVFDAEVRRLPGIYLWTVPLPEGHLVNYVGETGRSFEVRLLEHYKDHMTCMYHLYSPAEFAQGKKVVKWPGRYDPADRKSVRECLDQCAKFSSLANENAHIYRFFLAPLSCEKRTRLRIEAAIAEALYAAPGLAGTFQDIGIHYDPRTADEAPIECVVTSPVPLIGLLERIRA